MKLKKTLAILIAALLLGVCAVSAQKEVFEHYQKKDFEPHMKPLDLTPVADPANEWLLGVRNLDNGRIAYSERLGGRTFAVYRFHRK